jgi:hypothetical protein
MPRILLALGVLLLLAGCHSRPLALPAGWPLTQLTPPAGARSVPLGRLQPANQPYYVTGNDDSYQPAQEALLRLLPSATPSVPPVADPSTAGAGQPSSFAGQPVHSSDGSPGRAWGVAFHCNGGFDSALAQCEAALKPLRYEIQLYRPGRLRTYYARDRRTEVTLVAAKDERLLLCVVEYAQPLPGERELAQRDDLQHAAKATAEDARTRAAEIAAGK